MSINSVKTVFIVVTLIISAIKAADDYHQNSNEEVTMSSLDFFDTDGSNEFYIPRKQSLLPAPIRSTSSNIMYDGGQQYAAMAPSSVENILTTMLPSIPDPIQTTSSIITASSSLYDDDELTFNTTTTSTALNEIVQEQFVPPTTNSTIGLDYGEDQEEQAGTTTTTTPSSTTILPMIAVSGIQQPRTKQGKQIPISSLSSHEALRKFVDDSYIRRPLAILIDTAHGHLEQIKKLWIDALRPNVPLDCVLLAYNASGVPVTYNFTNTRMLLAGINSIQASDNSRGNGFFGIIRAIELIPYDSGIFVSTGFLPADWNLAQYAATALLKKRIRLYLTWLGEKPLTENETHEEAGGTLGRVAVRSGGEVILAESIKDPSYDMISLLAGQYQGTPDQDLASQQSNIFDLHHKMDTATRPDAASLETPTGG